MTEKNRFLLLALLAALTMLVLAACGGGTHTPPETTPVPEPEPEPEPIELEFTGWPAESAPGAEVTLQWTISGDHDKLILRQGEDGDEIDVLGQESHTLTLPGNLPVVQYTLAAALGGEEDSTENDSIEIDVPYWVCDEAGTEIQLAHADLEERIRALYELSGPLTCADVQQVDEIDLGNYGGSDDDPESGNPGQVDDLTGLQHFTGLRYFDAKWNEISDISALAGLTSLEYLDLDQNNVNDISPLSNLVNLRWIGFWNNNLTDLTPLGNLTNLEVVFLSENRISDLSPLANLTEVHTLFVIGDEVHGPDNGVRSVQPLERLTQLQVLRLGRNRIEDITPFAALHNLVWLEIDDNRIADISPLTGLPNLFAVKLAANYISDMSPLLDNDDFPAPLSITLPDPPPAVSTLDLSWNCIPQEEERDVMAAFTDHGVEDVKGGRQRPECDAESLSVYRTLRARELRESGGIR